MGLCVSTTPPLLPEEDRRCRCWKKKLKTRPRTGLLTLVWIVETAEQIGNRTTGRGRLWISHHGPTDLPREQIGFGRGPWLCPLLLLPPLFLLGGDHGPLCSVGAGPLQRCLCLYVSGGADGGLTGTKEHLLMGAVHLLTQQRWFLWVSTWPWLFDFFSCDWFSLEERFLTSNSSHSTDRKAVDSIVKGCK